MGEIFRMGKQVHVEVAEGWQRVFGERLAQLRGGRKQEEVAEALGIGQGTLSKHERCWEKPVPKAATIIRASEYFGVNMGYLLGTESERRGPGASEPLDTKEFPPDLVLFLDKAGATSSVILAKGMDRVKLDKTAQDSIVMHLRAIQDYLMGLRPPSTDEKDDGATRSDHSPQDDPASRGD